MSIIILCKKGSSSAYDEAWFLKHCVKRVLKAGKSSAGSTYSRHILIVVGRYLRHDETIQGIFIGKLLFLIDLTLELLVKRLNYVRGVDCGADCLRKVVERKDCARGEPSTAETWPEGGFVQ
ncbi:hypothetical protein BV56_0507 [Limosilactobacillus mucosae]|nr:hypothetical protein BV56_0507 [Limosilactobacillus mucosae]SUQ20144.1 hypothetical protein SAMN02744693_0507 [Limosilactobacillus mucosae]